MAKPSEVISDEALDAHAFGRFPGMSPRQVVNEGVLKLAMGYAPGSSMLTVLARHRLSHVAYGSKSRMKLSPRGRAYLRAMYEDSWTELLTLARLD